MGVLVPFDIGVVYINKYVEDNKNNLVLVPFDIGVVYIRMNKQLVIDDVF